MSCSTFSSIYRTLYKDPSRLEIQKKHVGWYSGRLRPGPALAMVKGAEDVEKAIPHIRVPFLIQQGALDNVADPKVIRRMYEEAATNDKTLRIVDDAVHAIIIGEREPIRNMLIDEMGDWVVQRAAGPIKAT